MPSLNQISWGLTAEAMVQLKLAMGKIKDQKSVLEAQAKLKKTWEDLLDHPKIEDKDASLIAGYDDKAGKPLGLHDPTYPVVGLCNFIYQMQSFVYMELNRASRFKDTSKIKTLGAYGAAFAEIIENT